MSQSTHAMSLRRTFKVAPSIVFEAFTEVEQLMQWWGPRGATCPSAEMDLRAGGKYRFSMKLPSGELRHVKGVYREIDPPRRLVFTSMWEGTKDMDQVDTLVTVDFLDRAGSTEVVVTHELFPTRELAALHNQGWSSSLDCLEEVVTR